MLVPSVASDQSSVASFGSIGSVASNLLAELNM